MFDVGFFEMLLIGVVALLVIGPERLPDVARTIGRWVGRTRRFITQVKGDIDREIQQEELRKAIEDNVPLDEIKQIMNKEIMSTDRFILEEESKPEYQVKAIPDETPANEKQGEQEEIANSGNAHGTYTPDEEDERIATAESYNNTGTGSETGQADSSSDKSK